MPLVFHKSWERLSLADLKRSDPFKSLEWHRRKKKESAYGENFNSYTIYQTL